jgi:hypothetical protein
MSEDDWARLEARVADAIAQHERTRRRLVLAIAAAILMLLVAVAATWWHSTRATPGSTAYVGVACADTASTSAPHTAMLPSDGSDPRSQCEREWRTGGITGAPAAPPAPLVACAGVTDGNPTVWVVPDAAAGTCARLGLEEVPAGFAASNRRFAELRDRIGTYTPEDDGTCVPYGDVRRRAQQALDALGYDDWEVARDPSTIRGDETCVWYWVADPVQHVVFVYGWSGADQAGS